MHGDKPRTDGLQCETAPELKELIAILHGEQLANQ
jgi:hypothetical protein